MGSALLSVQTQAAKLTGVGYLTHHADLGYQYRDSAFSATFGIGYQNASLTADRTFPRSTTTNKSYRDVLPNATIYLGVTRTNNIQILYRTATSPPAITQLENTVDNSNPLLLTMGNPDLKQYYSQYLIARYISTNLQTMQSMFLLLSGSMSYSSTPTLVNDESNTSNTATATVGGGLSINIGTDIDFTISYNANFNNVTNTVQASLDNRYFSHVARIRFNWIIWNGWTFRTDATNQLYTRSQTGFNQSYTLWNLTFGKKFLQDDRGELSAQVFDVLNQNKNVSQTVTDTYLQTQQTRNLNRYFLLTFSYRLDNL